MILNPPGQPAVGTAEHALLVTHGRHPGVQTAMAWLAFSHLPGPLQPFSRPIYMAAMELLDRIPNDSAELTTALNKLVEAKDWTVRAGIRSDTGAPGPVPRPATVVDPPTDWRQTARDVDDRRAARIAQHMPQWRENWPTTPAQAVKDGSGTSIPQNPGEPYMEYLARAARQLDAEPTTPVELQHPIHHYDDPEA